MMLALVRWWVVLLGGVLLGAGFVLRAMVMLARQSRAEVESVFFLWRGVGQLTFVFQDDQTKMALWLNEIPEEVLTHSDRGAWTLAVLGAMLALSACFIGSRRRRKK